MEKCDLDLQIVWSFVIDTVLNVIKKSISSMFYSVKTSSLET